MEIVYAASITAISGIIVALIQKFRKENQKDHNIVVDLVTLLHTDVKNIDQKLDNHIDAHLKHKI